MSLLPPIDLADYRLEPFHWCQIVYLYAREMVRYRTDGDASTIWNESISEATEVARILRDNDVILAPAPWLAPTGYVGDLVFGYPELVHWPSMICAANIYASLPPGERQKVRKSMEMGTPPIYILVDFASKGCDRIVIADPEYKPAPPCLPSKGIQAGWLALGAFVGTFGLLSTIGWLGRKAKR